MAKTLEFRGIGKSFPGVRALDNVNFIAEGGKVLALLGENGAGKSTLLKILSGDQSASEGEILVDGVVTAFGSPHDSQAAGISVIYQERQMMPSLSVMENLFAGALPRGKLGLVDKKTLYSEALKIIKEFGLDIDPAEEVGRLSIANQQMVEIMKAYRRDSDIIAYDEPTAPLSEKEIELMFKVIEKQKAAGKAIIYVSHRMNEIFRITDEIVVLKDGRQVTTLQTKETSEPELIKAMVGRDIGDTYANLRRNTPSDEVLLEVRNLTHIYGEGTPFRHVALEDCSLTIGRGELIGLIGHTGSGKSTLIQHFNGLLKPTSGDVLLKGESIFRSKKATVEARSSVGLVMQYPEYQLFEETVIKDVCFGPQNQGLSEEEQIERAKEALRLVNIDPDVKGGVSPFELSGGQKRRVAIAGVLAMRPEVLILDEPTAGLDPKGHDDILGMIRRIRQQLNMTIILVSHNMDDVAEYSDRVLVMNRGALMFLGTPREVYCDHEEELREIGLDIPSCPSFLWMLKERGLDVDDNKLKFEETADEIIRALKER